MKKKQNHNNGALVSMDSSAHAPDGPEAVPDLLRNIASYAAMDTQEQSASNVTLNAASRNIKKSAPKRRGYLVRKAKAIEKAISHSEKTQEKVTKSHVKVQRVHTLKSLY